MEDEPKFNFLIFAPLLFLIALNLVILDIVVFTKKREEPAAVVQEPHASPSICDEACQASVAASVAKLMAVTPSPLPPIPATLPIRESAAREYYIPLGSGKGKSDQWEAIAGAEAYIDTTRYPNIKEVTFEAYMRVPAGVGRMHVKLYNVTDGHDVWESELTTESDTSVRRSTTITLSAGNKLYRVLVKSTIRADAYLDNARIKLVTQ